MGFVVAIGAAVCIWLGFKIFRFFTDGGTFTQATRNSSYLYYRIKTIYPKLSEDGVRYLALKINTASARREFPLLAIATMVNVFSARSWETLCTHYTWEYAKLVGQVNTRDIPIQVEMKSTQKAKANVRRVEEQVRNGMRRKGYELMFRRFDMPFMLGEILEMKELGVDACDP